VPGAGGTSGTHRPTDGTGSLRGTPEPVTRQLPLRIGFTQRAGFDNFIRRRNEELLASLEQWLNGDRQDAVFYVWGTAGSGRSHLLSAACAWMEIQGRSFGYMSLEEIRALPAGTLEGLEQRELVCLDDIHRAAGHAQWEEAIFHLFNRLKAAKGRLLVTSETSPAALPLELEDLRSRLAWGLTYRVEPLDDVGKRALLTQQAAERGLELSGEAASFLLSRCPRDTRALVSMMDRLDLAALAAQRRLTIPFLRTQLDQPPD